MGTNPGVDVRIGWDESEQKEFLKALKQPLLVQTPLQLVIENLFQRLQAQATFIQKMKENMERIAVKDVAADELLERIKLIESKQGDAAGPKLNPFNQQEIISRLEALESKVTAEGPSPDERTPRDKPAAPAPAPSAAQPSPEATADLEVRLTRLEKRLMGVYNLNGKLTAIEQIAAGLGVPIPDLDYPTGGGPLQAGPGPAAATVQPLNLKAWRPPGTANGEQEAASPAGGSAGTDGWPAGFKGFGRAASPAGAPATTSGRAASRAASPTVDLGAGLSAPHTRGTSPSHSPRVSASPGSPPRMSPPLGSPSPTTGGAGAGAGASGVSSQKLVQLGQEVAAVRTETDALKESVASLVQQVAGLRTGLGQNAVESLSRLQHVEETVGALQVQVADMASSRRDTAARSGSDVTFADFSLLKSQVEASVADAKSVASAATEVAEKELPVLTARVIEMEEALRKKSEPRDIDALFHERINTLETSISEMKTEVLGSIETAMESTVKLDDLQALEELLATKAPTDAVRALQQQTNALGQAVAGISEAITLRPDLGDSMRASVAAGAGPGAVVTKMRCLTCDQPVRQGAAGPLGPGGPGGVLLASTGRGGFLPRLESMPGKEGLPGGPGIMVAELRANKEERLAGLQVGGTGRPPVALKAGELEEYANGALGGGRLGSPPRDGSPGRAVERSRAARVPVGVGSKAAGPLLGGKPVFL